MSTFIQNVITRAKPIVALSMIVITVISIGPFPVQAGDSPAPKTYNVTVNTDGSFSPSKLTINDGDTINWTLPSALDSVLASDSNVGVNSCLVPRPVSANPDLNLMSPTPEINSGIYSLGPNDASFTVEVLDAHGLCANHQPPHKQDGNLGLCRDENILQQTMESTWADPAVSGVYVRLQWDQLQTKAGDADANFDFSVLDAELDQAVKHGKKIAFSIQAGNDGTPDWLFTDGGVKGYEFQDLGSDDFKAQDSCGQLMTLGNPTDEAYQDAYFTVIRKIAEHVKTRSDWYNAIAYYKISGANLFTHENRLPSRCTPGCICNTQVWSQAGYTPDGLYNFYTDQMAVVQEEFPGLPMNYALIQEGFPLVANDGSYLKSNGLSSGTELPGSNDQTQEILDLGAANYGNLFVVQHSGLGPDTYVTPGTDCTALPHPADCPNRLVLLAGEAGQPTAFQTNNGKVILGADELQSTLQNLRDNSDATYLEIYEDNLWEVQRENGVLVPNAQDKTNTLQEWTDLMIDRRDDLDYGFGPSFNPVYKFTLNRVGALTKDIYVYNPYRCDDGGVAQKYMTITVNGSNVVEDVPAPEPAPIPAPEPAPREKTRKANLTTQNTSTQTNTDMKKVIDQIWR